MAQPTFPFSHVVTAGYVVLGCGLSVCMFFQMTGEGSGAPGVPFRYLVGCDEGCVVFGVCVSFPHRIAWVRGLQCFGMLLWFGAGGRHRWSLRSHFVARWGPACVFPFLCAAICMFYSNYFYPRGRGESCWLCFPAHRVMQRSGPYSSFLWCRCKLLFSCVYLFRIFY